ncbi:winged helix-turn-helix transcriptional regulator [Kineosporia sp. J2-2]|uniref:Winged helix-turn-helix transcriptional regulator n=1 Tax=Kineosporia corallincola TaxID=2835133 RepID=A0ABS5TI17_9ACTN|nr:MarR family winged helix-turn-helix transcriptional regulator [Kineosporia corallincola]MBT0770727.1 winged helix-turn-helix transcriptional regulator [Kineosporia corallincola]
MTQEVTRAEPEESRRSGADLRVLPMLDYLARLGRRAVESQAGTLRPRHVIALELLRDQGPCGQQRLAEALSLDPSNVVGLLNELEQRELITRRRDPADRRRHIVELSGKGLDELTRTGQHLGGIEDNLFGSLTPQERQTLHALLSRAVGASSEACVAAGKIPPPAECIA